MIHRLSIKTSGQGLYDFTSELGSIIKLSGIDEGLCTVMVQHTSASLVVQENADPAVQADLVSWLSRLVPEGDSQDRRPAADARRSLHRRANAETPSR